MTVLQKRSAKSVGCVGRVMDEPLLPYQQLSKLNKMKVLMCSK